MITTIVKTFVRATTLLRHKITSPKKKTPPTAGGLWLVVYFKRETVGFTLEELKRLSFSIYSSEYRGKFSPKLQAGSLLGVPKVPKQWGRGCPTGASCICAWVPTFKKQLGQFSFKETYLPGILGWGSHNKRLQFFVLCHHMWFFGELGKKNSINRLLAPEKQHHKKSWSHKILCPISLGRHQWKKKCFPSGIARIT